ncbi:Glucoamylase [Carex littledalei]|uniref:Glucoamylase n=1 Tax=Carex littledalei TaxID=544730 RepID=A0A833VNA4_9POAL|nr:Glucoamylase [Carex littledalei]
MDTLGRLKMPCWKQLPCSSSTFSFELKKKPISFPLSFVSPPCSLSISPKVDKEQSDSAILSTALPESDSMLVHVRFVLQKECMFGERFYLVGDDPLFGLWDPSNGIPLDWCDGHIWSARLEVPMGKKVEFKFVLLRLSGEVHWQPGPNRVLLLDWATTSTNPQASTVTVWEEWDSAGNQTISLEDEVAVSSVSSVMQDEIQVPGPDCNGGISDQSNKTGDNPELVQGDVDSGIISSTGPEGSESDSESNSGGMIFVPGLNPVKAVTQPELVQGDVDSGIISSTGPEGSESNSESNSGGMIFVPGLNPVKAVTQPELVQGDVDSGIISSTGPEGSKSDSESNSGGMILVPVKAVTQEDDLIDPLETGDRNYSLVKEITIDDYEDRSYKGKDGARNLKNTSSEEVIGEPTTASILRNESNDLPWGQKALQGLFSCLGFDLNQT